MSVSVAQKGLRARQRPSDEGAVSSWSDWVSHLTPSLHNPPYSTVCVYALSNHERDSTWDYLAGLSIPDTVDKLYVSSFIADDLRAIRSDWASPGADFTSAFYAALIRLHDVGKEKRLMQEFIRRYFESVVDHSSDIDEQEQLDLPLDTKASDSGRG